MEAYEAFELIQDKLADIPIYTRAYQETFNEAFIASVNLNYEETKQFVENYLEQLPLYYFQ